MVGPAAPFKRPKPTTPLTVQPLPLPNGPTTPTAPPASTPPTSTGTPDTTATSPNGTPSNSTARQDDAHQRPTPPASSGTPPPPLAGYTPPPVVGSPGNDTDGLLSNYVNQALGMDTTQQQATISQMEEDRLGKQLVNDRAAAGRAGVSGGVEQALEGDQMRAARHQAAQDLLGVQQQAYGNAAQAAGVDVQEKQAAEAAAREEAYNKMIEGILGGSPTPAPAAGGDPSSPTGANADPASTLTGGNSGGRIGDNTDNDVHMAPGATEAGWTLSTYSGGVPVWIKDGKTYRGAHPPSTGAVTGGDVSNPKPPGG